MKWVLTLGLLVTGSAMAQSFELSQRRKVVETPRNMFFEAKLSPFTPLIDRRFADVDLGERPYQAIFGGTPLLMGEIELEYQFFQKFGSLALGASVGYGEKFGHARAAISGSEIPQGTGLRLLPAKALLVYRFDWVKEHYHFPLVPYAKGAVVMMPWWVVNGVKLEANGFKFGLAGVLGLSLELDFIDPRLARDFDNSVGVNHTYIFAEFTAQDMTLLGPQTARPFDLSSSHFMFGLGFEF